jgi:hypothetical protein
MAHLQATRLYNKAASGAAAAAAAAAAADDEQQQQQQQEQEAAAPAADAAEPSAAAAGSAEQQAARRAAVGASLARVVHAHVCLLADTEARQSPTRASVWRAEQCLREWDRLEAAGLAAGAAGLGEHQVRRGAGAVLGLQLQLLGLRPRPLLCWAAAEAAGGPATRAAAVSRCWRGLHLSGGVPVDKAADPGARRCPGAQVPLLRRWARTADADLSLAEALHGAPLHPSQRLQVRRPARPPQPAWGRCPSRAAGRVLCLEAHRAPAPSSPRLFLPPASPCRMCWRRRWRTTRPLAAPSWRAP